MRSKFPCWTARTSPNRRDARLPVLLCFAAGALAWTLAAAEPGAEEAAAPAISAEILAAAVGDTPIPAGLEGLGPKQALRVRSRDSAVFRSMLDNGRDGQWSLRALGRNQPDPLLKDLVEWRRMSDSARVEWSDAKSFLDRRGYWPGMDRLRDKAEWAMPETLPRDQALIFFAESPPTTARGARIFGEALIDAGRQADGERWIIRGWRQETAPPDEERLYLQKHAALIQAHSAERLDMLVWRGSYNAAQRLSRALGDDLRALTDARLALLRSKGGVDRLMEKVPASLQTHPGLNYARMVWREKRNRRAEAEAAMLVASDAQDLGDPEAWADERLLFAREAFQKQRYQDAFDLADAHGLESGPEFAALQWFSGWLALRRLDRPRDAQIRFEAMWPAVETPISRSRAAYWAARAAEAAGDSAAARRWRERAADYPSAFYGQLAAQEIGREIDPRPAQTSEFMRIRRWTAAETDLARAAVALYRAGLPRDGRRFLERLAERRSAPTELRQIAGVARDYHDSAGEIAVAKIAERDGHLLLDALFPVPAAPEFDGRAVEPALLLAVARQESRFNSWARSGVGAMGLMQIMPATAQSTAKRLKLPYAKEQLLDSDAYNLTLGADHMRMLLDYYDGSYVLSVAAYNAGQGNVSKWLKAFGDPRDPSVDAVDWIETIPFNETRNYVQRVLEGVQVYRARLQDGPSVFAAREDLARGARPETEAEDAAQAGAATEIAAEDAAADQEKVQAAAKVEAAAEGDAEIEAEVGDAGAAKSDGAEQ